MSKGIFLCLIVIAGLKSMESVYLSAHADVVPVWAKPLQAFQSDDSVQIVLIGDLRPWEAMWCAYYMKNKIFEVTRETPYMRCESKKESNVYRHILTTIADSELYSDKEILFESHNVRLIRLREIPT